MMISSLARSPEFKVGLLVLVASVLVAAMALKSSSSPAYLGGSKDVWFVMDDASGLVKNSAVKIAGIDVGVIRDITLQNGRARVDMTIKSSTPATKSARIEIRPNGILGDKHVEIISGDPRDPPLRSGDQILTVDDKASIDKLLAEIGNIAQNLSVVSKNLKDATEGDTEKPLGKIMANIQNLTGDLSDLARAHKEDLGEIMANLREITDNVNDIVSQEGPDGLKARIKTAMEHLNSSLKNIDEITGKINRGEGTIGKLVSDKEMGEQVGNAVEGINNLLDSANHLETSLDFHANYMMGKDSYSKGFLSVVIQPGLDRYYELGVVSDPHGLEDQTDTFTTSDGQTVETKQNTYYKSKLLFNALFAKNFYDFTIRGGIMESTGGAGLDYYMFKRRLRLTVDAYDFQNFRMRIYARYTLFRGFYAAIGGEDLFTTVPAPFVGAGITLTNDDLKLLLTKLPL
jgi:phospholipid/cholesterol/gamma-HCH transport system substrate-binding protein